MRGKPDYMHERALRNNFTPSSEIKKKAASGKATAARRRDHGWPQTYFTAGEAHHPSTGEPG